MPDELTNSSLMNKINSPAELEALREKLHAQMKVRENSNHPELLPQIRVGMSDCGIAAGAKQTLARFAAELERQGVDAVLTQTGCMGRCAGEPMVEIALPGRAGELFEGVVPERVGEIVLRYIIRGESAVTIRRHGTGK